MYDVVIIGAGPAGISASLYLKRAKKNVLIVYKDIGALDKAHKIGNYYGVEEITGKDLFETGIKQAKNIGVEFMQDEVIGISFDEHFKITTVNREFESKFLILATGTNRMAPNIKGIKEFEGKGISYCAICDAFFYRNKDVAVLGNGNYALHEAKQLKDVVKSVTILTNGEQIVENRNEEMDFNVDNTAIKEFKGNKRIEEVEFEDNKTKKISGVFVAVGTASSGDLAREIGAAISNNNIIVDENMQTTVPGLYACGDCTGGLLQVNKAVFEGAKAALHIIGMFEN